MKGKFYLLLNITCFFVITLSLFNSCRKVDLSGKSDLKNEISPSENKFFNTNRSSDIIEKSLVEFIKSENSKKHFVEKTVAQIGYPRWDKMIKKPSSLAAHTNLTVMSIGVAQKVYDTSEIYYVPFVRDSQNFVNAAMVIKTSPTDTSFSYLCDWQYSRLQNNINALNDQPEYFAVFFMVLDNAVFGHTKFKILDKSIFRANNHDPREVTLKPARNSSNVNINTVNLVQFCQDVIISWTDCHFPIGHCTGPGGSCDGCTDYCTASYNYQYCWSQWVDDGISSSSSGVTPSGGSGGSGGGGGGGSSTPPSPCNIAPSSLNESGQAKVAKITTFSLEPCNSNPGWTPVATTPPTPCETAKAIAKKIDSIYAGANISSVVSSIPNLNTETKEKGFPIFQKFSVNPYNLKDTTFSTYISGEMITGTDSSIEGSFTVPRLSVLRSFIHTHPPIGYTPQSPKDVFITIENYVEDNNFKGGLVAAYDGSQYALTVTNPNNAIDFLKSKTQFLENAKWKEDSDIGKSFKKAINYFRDNNNNDLNKENLAYEMAMAAVLKQYNVGITLNKKGPDGLFKPIIVNTIILDPNKPKRITYTQDCL